MNDKSHVTMEQKICPVCGKTFGTNSIIFDTRMRNRFDRHTVTGWGLCPEHQEMHDNGFIACIEIDRAKSQALTPDKVYRLGRVAFMHREMVKEFFKESSIPENAPMIWVESGVIDMLEQIHAKSANDDEPTSE